MSVLATDAEVAAALADDILSSGRAGDLTKAERVLAALERLVSSGAELGDSGVAIGLLLEQAVDAVGSCVDEVRALALRIRYLEGVVRGVGAGDRMGLLEPLLIVAKPAADADALWTDYVELQLGVVLGRLGRRQEAIDVLERLLRRAPRSVATEWVAFQAGYAIVRYEWQLRDWDGVTASAGAFAKTWQGVESLTSHEKQRLALAMWMRCGAVVNATRAAGRDQDPRAYTYLDDLVIWLRSQAPLLQVFLAHRLINKVQWNAPNDSALDALEEFVPLLKVMDHQDVVELADGMLSETIWLNYAANRDDAQSLRQSRTRALRRFSRAPRPDEIGLSEATVVRYQRLSKALEALAQRLATIPEDKAFELRSEALIGALAPLGALGLSEKQRTLFAELVALGGAAIAACDSIAARMDERGRVGMLGVAARLIKAQLLLEHHEADAAASILRGLVAEYENSHDPLLVALSEHARRLLVAVS